MVGLLLQSVVFTGELHWVCRDQVQWPGTQLSSLAFKSKGVELQQEEPCGDNTAIAGKGNTTKQWNCSCDQALNLSGFCQRKGEKRRLIFQEKEGAQW